MKSKSRVRFSIKFKYWIPIRLIIIGLLTLTIFIFQPFKVNKSTNDRGHLCCLLSLIYISTLAQPVNKLKLTMPDEGSQLKLDHVKRQLQPLGKELIEPSGRQYDNKSFEQKKK